MVLPLVSCWWCSLLLLLSRERNNQPSQSIVTAGGGWRRERHRLNSSTSLSQALSTNKSNSSVCLYNIEWDAGCKEIEKHRWESRTNQTEGDVTYGSFSCDYKPNKAEKERTQLTPPHLTHHQSTRLTKTKDALPPNRFFKQTPTVLFFFYRKLIFEWHFLNTVNL